MEADSNRSTGHRQEGHSGGSRWPRWIGRLFLPLLPMLLLGLFRDELGESCYPTALLAYAPPLPLALAAAAGVLPGLRRRPRIIAALQLALGARFVLDTSGFALRRPQPPEERAGMRVLTCNVYRSGVGVAPLATLVQTERPDVVCLQEAAPGPRDTRRGWRELDREFPAGWRLVRQGELVIATHLPVESAAWVPLSRRVPADWHHDRDALRVTVRVAGRLIHVVTTHLSVPTAPWLVPQGALGAHHWRFLRALRHEQTGRLLTALKALQAPVVLAGDFNSTPACQAYERMARGLGDAFEAAGAGWGYTFPAICPLLRLDYIFADRRLTVVSCRVIAAADADHRPVAAHLRLPAAEPAEAGLGIPGREVIAAPGLSSPSSGGWRRIIEIEEAGGRLTGEQSRGPR
jgi:vancomycin resistance protein VanJ